MKKLIVILLTSTILSFGLSDGRITANDSYGECIESDVDLFETPLFDSNFPQVKKVYKDFHTDLYLKEKKGFGDIDLIAIAVDIGFINGPKLSTSKQEFTIVKDTLSFNKETLVGDVIFVSEEIACDTLKLKPALYKALTESMKLGITSKDSRILEERSTDSIYIYSEAEYEKLFSTIGCKMEEYEPDLEIRFNN